MNRRALVSTFAAAVLGTTLIAQGDRQQDRTPTDTFTPAAQITLIGCVQRESDFRQGISTVVGTSGTAASGSNQFVLINASLDAPAVAEPIGKVVGSSGATSGMTSAYSLAGTRAADLARHVGKRVEVKGAIAPADPRTGNPGVSPTRPILQMVTVSSIREVAGSCRM